MQLFLADAAQAINLEATCNAVRFPGNHNFTGGNVTFATDNAAQYTSCPNSSGNCQFWFSNYLVGALQQIYSVQIPGLMWTSRQAQQDFQQFILDPNRVLPTGSVKDKFIAAFDENQALANKTYNFLITKYDFLDWSIAVFNVGDPLVKFGYGFKLQNGGNALCGGDTGDKSCSDNGGGWVKANFPPGDQFRSKNLFITWSRNVGRMGKLSDDPIPPPSQAGLGAAVSSGFAKCGFNIQEGKGGFIFADVKDVVPNESDLASCLFLNVPGARATFVLPDNGDASGQKGQIVGSGLRSAVAQKGGANVIWTKTVQLGGSYSYIVWVNADVRS